MAQPIQTVEAAYSVYECTFLAVHITTPTATIINECRIQGWDESTHEPLRRYPRPEDVEYNASCWWAYKKEAKKDDKDKKGGKDAKVTTKETAKKDVGDTTASKPRPGAKTGIVFGKKGGQNQMPTNFPETK